MTLAGVLASPPSVASAQLQRLKVSPDGRFLMKSDGQPFFYLADTAWELFHRTDRKQAVEYLQKRADQSSPWFTRRLAELDGLSDREYGDLP